ncbi:hypothetical protein FRY98_24710 [Paenibacillus faecis]|uniref:Uncharacterized protein n=1 Tax=Paenibacillus faecis TaxID=862114 RepID=A0A5D0CM75_9BACL|nr:hypothetical protein [Paenibacillus faecis]TYA10971.1 hypothetical protein FRY98_24710 [Paenibacillus faecis]
MYECFYAGARHAVQASKSEMVQHAEEIKALIDTLHFNVEVIAVNRFYKWDFIGRPLIGGFAGSLHVYVARPDKDTIRRDYEFRGYGGDVWEQAPNFVQLKDLENGQVEPEQLALF